MKNKSKTNIWVVVKDKDYNKEVHTQVWRTLIQERHKVPVMWAEAAVQQHPEMEAAVIEVAQMFVLWSIADEKSVMELIGAKIRRAQTEYWLLPKQTIWVVTFK
jgi:hypothetical protein